MRPINRSTAPLIAIAMFYVTAPAALAQCSWNTLPPGVNVPTAQDVPVGGYIDTFHVLANY